MAGRDVKNVNKEFASVKSQFSICDAEMKVQGTQLPQASETLEWYIAKYAGEQLYAWMESLIRKLLYQAYLLQSTLLRRLRKPTNLSAGSMLLRLFWIREDIEIVGETAFWLHKGFN